MAIKQCLVLRAAPACDCVHEAARNSTPVILLGQGRVACPAGHDYSLVKGLKLRRGISLPPSLQTPWRRRRASSSSTTPIPQSPPPPLASPSAGIEATGGNCHSVSAPAPVSEATRPKLQLQLLSLPFLFFLHIIKWLCRYDGAAAALPGLPANVVLRSVASFSWSGMSIFCKPHEHSCSSFHQTVGLVAGIWRRAAVVRVKPVV